MKLQRKLQTPIELDLNAARPKLEIYDPTSLPAPKEISRWFYDGIEPILGRNINLATEFRVRLRRVRLSGPYKKIRLQGRH
jgi:hypothetical protein